MSEIVFCGHLCCYLKGHVLSYIVEAISSAQPYHEIQDVLVPVTPSFVKLMKYDDVSMSVSSVRWRQRPWIQIVIYSVMPELIPCGSTETHHDICIAYKSKHMILVWSFYMSICIGLYIMIIYIIMLVWNIMHLCL